MPRKTALAAFAGLVLLAAAPAAFAGDRDGEDGWGPPDRDCGCEHSQDVHLDSSFFYDAGGVGPAFVDYGSSGGTVIEFTGQRLSSNASASAFASANARASAQARAFVSVRVRAHGGMMHGGKHY